MRRRERGRRRDASPGERGSSWVESDLLTGEDPTNGSGQIRLYMHK